MLREVRQLLAGAVLLGRSARRANWGDGVSSWCVDFRCMHAAGACRRAVVLFVCVGEV